MKVPFVNLGMQYDSLRGPINEAVQNVIDETAFIGGKFVSKFENEFAEEYGAKRCVSVANGTDAIYLSLRALGIGAGDEVITTSISWIATSEVISQTGAQPVFVDVEPDGLTIDVEKIEEKITPKTKAIIPVHLYGAPADMSRIVQICGKHNLYLIEDCAQAHFSTYHGQKVGTFGDIATFSFYPGKNLGAYGDGGAIITDDEDLADKVRMIAQHGSLVKHHHLVEGVNSRLDGIQAAILSVKLPHIHDWNRKRFEAGTYYIQQLREHGDKVKLPVIKDAHGHIFHVFCIRLESESVRDRIAHALSEAGIQNGIHYPTPLPLLKAYDRLGHVPEDFPVAYDACSRMLSLPMFPEITREQQDYVCQTLLGLL